MVSKWDRRCDKKLHKLVEYIDSSLDVKMVGWIGDDKADVVDMTKSGLKEMTYENIEAMKNDPEFKITPVISGNYVKFYGSPPEGKSITSKDLLYHFRTKLRQKSNGGLELKLYPEVGNLAYNAKKAAR